MERKWNPMGVIFLALGASFLVLAMSTEKALVGVGVVFMIFGLMTLRKAPKVKPDQD